MILDNKNVQFVLRNVISIKMNTIIDLRLFSLKYAIKYQFSLPYNYLISLFQLDILLMLHVCTHCEESVIRPTSRECDFKKDINIPFEINK